MDSCLTDCQCSNDFSPVCDQATSQTYFSACSAGCTSSNGTAMYDCSCIGTIGTNIGTNAALTPGYCETDCNTPLMAFLITQFVLHFIASLGRQVVEHVWIG